MNKNNSGRKESVHMTVDGKFVDAFSFNPAFYSFENVSQNYWKTGNQASDTCTVQCVNVSTGEAFSFQSPIVSAK